MSHFLFYLAIASVVVITVTLLYLVKANNDKQDSKGTDKDDDFEVRGI